MTKLLVATRNKAKLNDFKQILSDFNLELLSLDDVGITQVAEEKGKNFEENSSHKARFYSGLSHLPTLADDGGLEIDSLGGWPGVISRRIFGPDKPEATDEEMITEVLRRLNGVPQEERSAHMTAVVSLFVPPDDLQTSKFSVDGLITQSPSKILIPGFPFRSVFFLPKLGIVASELQKDDSSYQDYLNHRKNAILQLEPYLKKLENYA